MEITKVDRIKVVFVGDSNVGKTSIVSRQQGSYEETTEPTLGASMVCLKKYVEELGRTVELTIWDTAGQEKYQGLMPMYFRGANVAVCVCDCTVEDSLEHIKKWNDLVDKHTDSSTTRVLVVNKIDLDSKLDEIQISHVAGFINASMTCKTSAHTGEGVEALFNWIYTTEEIPRTVVEVSGAPLDPYQPQVVNAVSRPNKNGSDGCQC